MQPLEALKFTIGLVLQNGRPAHGSRRCTKWIEPVIADYLTDALVERLARSGYTITNRDGQVVVQGRTTIAPNHIAGG